MSEFDYSQYDNGDDYTTVDAIYDMLRQADNTSRPMSILLECYNKYENHTSEADAIANDKEALAWLDDYWEYVCWTERGNQIGMEELGGFKGMAETITNPYFAQQVIDYLQYDDEIDVDAQNLIDRLRKITSRYNGVSKMKKSIDEDAVFEFIKNSNSCCYGEIYDYCKDIGMSDQQIDDAISNLKSKGKIDFVNQMDYVIKSSKKMKKSAFDNIPQTFYVDLDNGRTITFSKEEYPMGVRWLHDNKDIRFYSIEGEEVFPVLQFSENGDGRTLMLFEEKDWANDYYGEYTDTTGIDAVIEFEKFVNEVLAGDVYIGYGDEDIMESTKKMKKSEDELIEEVANNVRIDLEACRMVDDAETDYEYNGSDIIIIVTLLDNDMDLMDEVDDVLGDMQGWGYTDVSFFDVVDEEWREVKISVSYDDALELYKKSSGKSTRKSIPNIHDMIAQCRQNNNSLVKSRVRLR